MGKIKYLKGKIGWEQICQVSAQSRYAAVGKFEKTIARARAWAAAWENHCWLVLTVMMMAGQIFAQPTPLSLLLVSLSPG